MDSRSQTERMCKVIEDEIESKPEEAGELQRESHRLREKVKKVLRKQKDKKIKSNMTHQERRGKKNKLRGELYNIVLLLRSHPIPGFPD